MVKYPFITCKMVGEDGNAFACIGRVQEAMRSSKVISRDHIRQFRDEAMSGDFDDLLATCMETVCCDPSDEEKEAADELLENLKDKLIHEDRQYFDPELDKEFLDVQTT